MALPVPKLRATLVPFAGPGPELPLALGGPAFATLADLSSLDVSLIEVGSVAWVENRGPWVYRDITATPDGQTIAVANGPGVWCRGAAVVPATNVVDTWYVDTAAGSDDNDGKTPATPLKTVQEYLLRLGRQPIAQNTVVNIAGDVAAPLSIRVAIEQGVALFFQGTRSVVQSYTLSGVTPWAPSTSTSGAYTLSGAPNLAPYAGAAFVRLSANHQVTSPVVVNLGGGAFRGVFCDTNTFGQVEPTLGASVDLYTLNKIPFDVEIAVDGYGYVGLVDLDVGTPGANHSVRLISGGAYFATSIVHGLDIYEAGFDAEVVGAYTLDFRSYGSSQTFASVHGSAGGAACAARGGGVVQIQSLSFVQGGGIVAGHDSEGPGDVKVNAPLGILDCPQAFFSIYVLPGSAVRMADRVFSRTSGSAQTTAVNVMGGGAVRYASGLPVQFAGTLPSTAYLIGGTSKTTGQIPYAETANGAYVVVDQ